MTPTQLNNLLRFIKRTGDKAIVLDQASDESFVLLPFASYERLAETYDELWEDDDADGEYNAYQNASAWHDPFSWGAPVESSKPDGQLSAEEKAELDAVFSSDEAAEIEPPLPRQAPGERQLEFDGNWAPEGAAALEPAQDSLSEIPHEEEEEKFYLEPVE